MATTVVAAVPQAAACRIYVEVTDIAATALTNVQVQEAWSVPATVNTLKLVCINAEYL